MHSQMGRSQVQSGTCCSGCHVCVPDKMRMIGATAAQSLHSSGLESINLDSSGELVYSVKCRNALA